MLFLNPWLLGGVAAASIPVILHLVRQQAAKPIEWGAMRFLSDTLSIRRRRMEWEDLLLMATRCMLLGLVALAIARPFVPPDSRIPWLTVLPAGLIGIALLGGSFVLGTPKVKWAVRTAAIVLLVAAGSLVFLEKIFNLKRFEASGRRDVALVIDASASMEILTDGKSHFQRAMEEARELVEKSPAGTAFSVILGGPAPEAKTSTPLTHRADVLGVLDQLKPVGGTFRAHDALGMATLGLAQGSNASKEIVVFTDSQRSGWRLETPNAWDQLGAAWKSMPAKPKLVLRNFGKPDPFRNLAVNAVELPRQLVGTDREMEIRVTIANTGSEAITAAPVTLEVDEKKSGEQPVGLLVAGQTETVVFRHRFSQRGPHVIRAAINGFDDLPGDNQLQKVVVARASLPVLLVDGNPAGSFFDRAAGYTALALAPSGGLIDGGHAAEKFLMDPKVVPANALTENDLADVAVVVLADVPRLPAAMASRLAAKVAGGTGLIILAGPRAEAAFYNTWTGSDGLLLPLSLETEAVDQAGISPSPATFHHEALAWFGKSGDLDGARIKRWRKTGPPLAGGIQAAAFSNGDAFLASRRYGDGGCLLATCAFDARSGNLPARHSFVPLVHELVMWVAGGGVNLNSDPGWSPSVILNHASGGLTATYFKSWERREAPVLQRIDPIIDFDWNQRAPGPGMPNDRFSIQWQGTLVPPISGNYQLECAADDTADVKLGDLVSLHGDQTNRPPTSVKLDAGREIPITIDFQESGGDAHIRLYWTPPGGTRQIIPATSFRPLKAGDVALKAMDPNGMPRDAKVRSSRRGRELAIDGAAIPGIYEVTLPPEISQLSPEGTGHIMPVAVTRDPGESRFEPMTTDDLSMIRKRIDVLQPHSVADVLGVLEGRGFGREIWKLLAVAGFILFLLESFLTRWVARARRTTENVRVDFGEATAWRG